MYSPKPIALQNNPELSAGSHPLEDSSHRSLTIFVSQHSSSQRVQSHSPRTEVLESSQSTATRNRIGTASGNNNRRTRKPVAGPPNASSQGKKKATPACCTTPIPAIFAVACLVIAGAFAANTAAPLVTFYSQLTTNIKHSFAQGLEGSMKYITDPLDQTVVFVNQMKDMIEASPQSYACDDSMFGTSFPGNASNGGFFYEAGMYALQRPTLRYIYQTVHATHFTYPGGSPIPTVCLLDPSSKRAYIFANSSGVYRTFANRSDIAKMTVSGTASKINYNINSSTLSYDTIAYNTSTWVSGVIPNFGGSGAALTKYAFIVPIVSTNPSVLKWGLGVDHTMRSLETTLLKGTPPITVGDDVTTPSQYSGSHTTLYDLNANLLMASTHEEVPVVKDSATLWTAGQSPVAVVNNAYQRAIQYCSSSSACRIPFVSVDGNEIFAAYRVVSAASKLNLLVVSSVPRHHFFAEVDSTLIMAVCLACGCTFLVIVGCIVLSIFIFRPLASLSTNMLEAAELHNDRVEHTHSYLREIATVSAVFDQMNQQLLIARSFVPEAVLLGKTEDSQEDAGDDEGSVEQSGDRHSPRHASAKTLSRGPLEASSVGGSSATRTTNSSNNTGAMTKLFNISEKRVAVLSVNLIGFHRLCASDRPSTKASNVHDVSTALLSAVVACAHQERGVMDSFHGDHFILTFNASRVVAGPLAAAIRTAHLIIEEVNEDASFNNCLGIAAGASAGRAHVGTFGIDGYRRLSVIGEPFRQATLLQQAAVQILRINNDGSSAATPLLCNGCLIEEPALKEIANSAFHAQAVGNLQTSRHRASGGEKAPLIAYLIHRATPVQNAGKGGEVACDDGEWLYELNAIESSNPFLAPNRAMLSLFEGNHEACAALVDANRATLLKHRVTSLYSLSSQRNNGGPASLHSASFEEDPSTVKADVTAWDIVSRYLTTYRDELKRSTADPTADPVLAASKRFALPWVAFQQ